MLLLNIEVNDNCMTLNTNLPETVILMFVKSIKNGYVVRVLLVAISWMSQNLLCVD